MLTSPAVVALFLVEHAPGVAIKASGSMTFGVGYYDELKNGTCVLADLKREFRA